MLSYETLLTERILPSVPILVIDDDRALLPIFDWLIHAVSPGLSYHWCASVEEAREHTGFSAGGDDYLVKPVDPLELRARVLAQLRNCREQALQSSQLRAGSLRIDLAAHQALLEEGADGTREVSLTPTEYKLLLQLARHESQVFTRDQLLQALSGGRTHVTDRTIDAHLCRLRKKLEACTHGVEPIYGVGYKFTRKAA